MAPPLAVAAEPLTAALMATNRLMLQVRTGCEALSGQLGHPRIIVCGRMLDLDLKTESNRLLVGLTQGRIGMRSRNRLTPAEKRLLHELPFGQEVNYLPGEEDEPDLEHAAAWGPERLIRAQFLCGLLTGSADPSPKIQSTGIQVRGVRISGLLSLDSASTQWPLRLRDCLIEEMLDLTATRGSVFELANCQVPGILADGLIATRGVFIRDGFRTTGEVRLNGAQVGELDCSGGLFENPSGVALHADSLNARGSALLRNGFRANGEVRLGGAKVAGNVSFWGATLRSPSRVSLDASGLVCSGNVGLRGHFKAHGEVRLLGTEIKGILNCEAGEFINEGGAALSCDRLVAQGGVFLRDGFSAKGEVRLIASQVGALYCHTGLFSNPGRIALLANNMVCRGDALLRRGASEDPDKTFRALGEIRFYGASVEGLVDFTGAVLDNPSGFTLAADRLRAKQGLLLSGDFVSHGQVRLLHSQLGLLNCSGGTFTNPSGTALDANAAVVKGPVFLRHGFTADGQVRMLEAVIEGQLDCSRAIFRNPGGTAFLGTSMKVGEAFLWRQMEAEPQGIINLRFASVGPLIDDRQSWQSAQSLVLEGFTYRRLAGVRRPNDGPLLVRWFKRDSPAAQRLEWLSLQPTFVPQPYEQLARTYREAGRERDARTVAIAKQSARRRILPWPRKIGNWFLGVTVGYGYKPWRAFWIIFVMFLIGSYVFTQAARAGAMLPSRALTSTAAASNNSSGQPKVSVKACTDRYPCFRPEVYSLELLLPVVNLHQREFWVSDASTRAGKIYRAYGWIAILSGWILTTLLVAGITGILRKD